MNKHQSLSMSKRLNWGAAQIAGLYLLIGGLWILFSDRVADRIALSQEMLTKISLYKGWGFVLVTALLLYLLIRRHTAALRASQVQLQRVIDAMPMFISYIDSNRRYQFTNHTYKEWFDDQVEGKPVQEVIGRAAYQTASKYIDKVLTGETTSYETELSYQGNEHFLNVTYIPDIGVDGRVKGFFVMGQDRTAQKQAEEELRLWANAFEGCAHGIAIGDPQTNRIVVCNPAFASLHKCRVEDIVGTALLGLYLPSDHEHVRRSVERADQIGHTRYEARMIRKNGSIFPVQMDVVSVLGEDGDLVYRVVTAQDISERKSIDEKLKASETKYRTLAEHLPVITYISGPDQYVGVTYISPQIETLGFDVDTWLDDPEFWFRQIHPDDQEQVTEELQRFQADAESFKAEYRLMLPNGETRWFHDESIRVKDESGRTILKQGFMLDITENKQVEQENKSLARFPNENPNPVLRATNDGKIIYANSTSEPLLKDWESNVGGYLPTDWINLISELITTGSRKTLDVQCGATTYSFMIVPVPEASYVNLYGRDVTERKRAEEALQKSQRLLQDVIDNSSSLIYLLDLEGRFLLINRRLEAVLGKPRAELIGKTREAVLPLEIAAKHRANDVKVIETHSSITMEEEYQESDGRHIYLSNKFPLVDQNGNLYGVGGISTDITGRKQAEETLLNSQAQVTGIFNSAMDAIISTDADQRILIFNPAAEAMFRCPQSEAIGQLLERFIPERFREEHRKHINHFGRTGVTSRAMKGSAIVFGLRSNGKEFPAEASISQVDIAGKKIYTVIMRDITERIQAEEVVRQSEERFASVFRSSPTPIALTRLADGKIMDVNEAFCQLFEYSRAEIVGRTSLEVGMADPGSHQEAVEQLREKGTIRNLEQKASTRNGRQLDILNSVETINVNGEPYALTTLIDITERKQAEDYLRRFELLSEHSRDIILFMGRADGHILDANAAATQAYGYNRDELLALTIGDLRAPDTQGLTATQMAQADAGGILFETIHRRKDGSTFPVEVSSQGATIGGVRTLISIVRDITERKQIEKALQVAHDELELKVQERTAELSKANALLQALMDNMPDHIYFKDTQSRFIRNSKSQADLLGLSDPSEVVGKTDFDFFPHAAKAFAEEQEIMRSGKPMVDFEEWVVWPDGRETWVSTTKLPLRNSEGQTIGIFGISHDITERKRSEQSIQQLNTDLQNKAEQLQASNRELEAFSYSVSHDLRAPLRAIDGYTRILVEDYESILDAEGKRICGIISREARRMGQLIDDLLAFSRLGRKEMYSSKIDMRTLAVSVLNDLVKEEDRERIDFQVGKLPPVRGDSSLIRQVWVNLISNALKFTSKKERAVIEVGSKQSKDETIYYVRDTGAGFDMEYANKLFGVFQRLHSESEFDGTGVGLAIVQRIIHRHAGRAWAAGEVDKGATFYFALPRRENPHE